MDIKAVVKQLGIKDGWCPRDITNRIDHLLETEETSRLQARTINVLKLALKVQDSKTPLSDIALFLDTHTGNGSVTNVGLANVLSLCKELEKEWSVQTNKQEAGDE